MSAAPDAQPTQPAEEIVPEDKDWTWVIEQTCSECGFDPRYPVADTGRRLASATERLAAAMSRPEATTRPRPDRWSPVEYVCHVRDGCGVFTERLRLMLDEDTPTFANWDQDATAMESRYADASPDAVAAQVRVAGGAAAGAFTAIRDGQWERRGLRSNGSEFTVRTLAIYFLHDVEHHVHDIDA